jgi:excisionase family DNA binding protein
VALVGNTARTTAMPEGSPWLTIGEVAALLKVHPNTVRRLILNGRLPAVRFGGRGSAVRINPDDLDTFVNASRITPGNNASTDAGR